jgi:hypothetical protein
LEVLTFRRNGRRSFLKITVELVWQCPRDCPHKQRFAVLRTVKISMRRPLA